MPKQASGCIKMSLKCSKFLNEIRTPFFLPLFEQDQTLHLMIELWMSQPIHRAHQLCQLIRTHRRLLRQRGYKPWPRPAYFMLWLWDCMLQTCMLLSEVRVHKPGDPIKATRLGVGFKKIQAWDVYLIRCATIAQWSCLHTPSWRPGFKSQAHHLCFYHL